MKQLEEKKAASLDEKGTVEMIREDFPVKEYESPQTKKTAVETEGGFALLSRWMTLRLLRTMQWRWKSTSR